jgi:integrase
MKELANTKATVRLRKVEDRKEWYLYIESYPVFVKGKKAPQRVREYVNRTVTTVEWDKKRTARTEADGSKTYKPKRDENGLIVCRGDKDRESVIYADGVRKLRQKEYDNADLYTVDEVKKVEAKLKAETNFMEYFSNIANQRNKNRSESIRLSWLVVLDYLKQFAGETFYFANITEGWCEDFKNFLLTVPSRKSDKSKLSQNSASNYFSIFKAALHKAFIDGFLNIDIGARIKGIKELETRREFLTVEELNILATTPCDRAELKRAALFSALTGLRHCDIQKLQWKEIVISGDQARLNFTQQKTKGVEYMPISQQALQLCGPQGKPNELVFDGLPDPAWISDPLKRWIIAAGITKKITFHCFRHTYATLQLSGGTDIYTVSKMLGHTDVKTTQIYAKVVDEKKREAANTIKLDFDKL